MTLLIDGRPIRFPISGTAKFIIELHKELKLQKHVHNLYVHCNNPNSQYRNLFDNKHAVIFSGNSKLRNLAWEFIPNLSRRNEKYDVLHETFFGNLNYKFKRKITTVHDIIPLDHPDWFNRRLSMVLKRNFRRQEKTSNTVVFSSSYTQARALAHGFVGQSKVIHLAASKSEAIDLNRSILHSISPRLVEEDYVTILGNIEPRKSHWELAKAIDYINKNTRRKINLVIVGAPINRTEEITKRIKDLLGGRVVFTGFVDEALKLLILKNTACHAYVSKYEGFGLPVVESIIDDIPSIFFQASSVSELIPHPDFAVQSLDSKQLAQRILDNFYRPPSSVLSRQEMIDFKKNFSWRRVADEYRELY